MERKNKEEIPLNPVTDCDQMIQQSAEDRILTIRGAQVIIDRDLASLYNIETKRLNQQANRNQERFPLSFRFQLSPEEKAEVVANCNRFKTLKFSSTRPYVYTEQGVAMLSAVLHTPTAVQVSVRIMEAFVAMRRFLVSNAYLFQRLDRIEYKLVESDHKFEDLYSKLEERSIEPRQGIFYDGQVYDAYKFVISLIKSATKHVVLIDNYVDESVLTMLDNRSQGVAAEIYTQQVSHKLQLDIDKHDQQYPAIPVKVFTKSHDRFLIIDDDVYHIGASLKDLGKKWFAFSKMNDISRTDLLDKVCP